MKPGMYEDMGEGTMSQRIFDARYLPPAAHFQNSCLILVSTSFFHTISELSRAAKEEKEIALKMKKPASQPASQHIILLVFHPSSFVSTQLRFVS
jgi:hypothetical protein